MKLQEKILTHWNVPVKALAWQKLVLENRGILHELRLSTWESQIIELEDFTADELSLLKHVILSIDPLVEHFDVKAFYSLVSETMARYEQDRFVLLKYTAAVTYGDLWNEWYRLTRGTVIDLHELELVTFNLRKFYNLFEKPETELPFVLDQMATGSVTQYIKEDGSNVSISLYNNQLFVSTPGGFDSDQAIYAKRLVSSHHDSFIEAIQQEFCDFTFVFEYVSPFNQIVVHYTQEELILLHVLDKRNGSILAVDEVQSLAVRFGFRPCRTVTDDFMTLIEDSKDIEKYPAKEHEGWVIRIDQNQGTFFLKLKCSDYANLHRVISQSLNPRWILESIIDETIDDKIAKIESEEIRRLVNQMLTIFYDWNEQKRSDLYALYTSFPDELWIEDEVILNFLRFSSSVDELLPDQAADSYLYRIRAFLDSFSKGKLDNPKEELILLASVIFDKVRDQFSELEGYDAYKMKTSIWVSNYMKQLKEEIDIFALNGTDAPNFVSSKFEDYCGFINPKWETIFSERKDEFNQLVQSKRENLRPHQFEIHAYALKKRAFLTLQKEVLTHVKQKITSYLIGDSQDIEVDLLHTIPAELVINASTRSFYEQLRQFETVDIFTMLPADLHVEKANTVLKEVMLMLRGKESDDAFSVAKSIFSQLPKEVKDQTAYYKARGVFSAYVNQKLPTMYKFIFFEVLTTLQKDRGEQIKEKSFYSLIDVVTDSSQTTFSETQLDFRDIQRVINNKTNEE